MSLAGCWSHRHSARPKNCRPKLPLRPLPSKSRNSNYHPGCKASRPRPTYQHNQIRSSSHQRLCPNQRPPSHRLPCSKRHRHQLRHQHRRHRRRRQNQLPPWQKARHRPCRQHHHQRRHRRRPWNSRPSPSRSTRQCRHSPTVSRHCNLFLKRQRRRRHCQPRRRLCRLRRRTTRRNPPSRHRYSSRLNSRCRPCLHRVDSSAINRVHHRRRHHNHHHRRHHLPAHRHRCRPLLLPRLTTRCRPMPSWTATLRQLASRLRPAARRRRHRRQDRQAAIRFRADSRQ